MKTRLNVEPLETRRAPATLVDAKTVTFQDTDGDDITVSFSKPVLTSAAVADTVFHFDIGSVNGSNLLRQQLREIDLTGLPAGISVGTLGHANNGGNGGVDVGWVNATGKDVGTVGIAGDLGRVTAGDANAGTPGLKSLLVGSLGMRGLTTQAIGGSLVSAVTGKLANLSVALDVQDARLTVTGSIGTVFVGGSLRATTAAADTGQIQATGKIGPVEIRGDISGGAADRSGLRAGGTVSSVTVGGSILGGGGAESASVFTRGGNLSRVLVQGDVRGGTGAYSASIRALQGYPIETGGRIGSVTVVGAVVGDGVQSAMIRAATDIGSVKLGSLTGGAGADSALVQAASGGIGNGGRGLGPVTVTGDVKGGGGTQSAYITSNSNTASVTIGGSLIGGTGNSSGRIGAFTRVGPVRVGGNVTGGDGEFSGSVTGDQLALAIITGDLVGGAGDFSGRIRTGHALGSVVVQNLTGGTGIEAGSISSASGGVASVFVFGSVQGGKIHCSKTLGPIHIQGDLVDSRIAANEKVGVVRVDGNVTNSTIDGDHHVGSVFVTGSWTAGNIISGFTAGPDGVFGTPDDYADFHWGAIETIAIGGSVTGTAGGTDHFGFVSHHINVLKVGGQPVTLKAGPANDNISLGTTGDCTLIEL